MNENGFVSIQRPDGKVLDFGVSYFEKSIEGAGILNREIYSESRGNGHGDIVIGSRYPAREIVISSDTMVTDSGNLRDKIDRFFIYPEALHRVTIKYKNSTKWISGYIEVYDLPLDYVGAPQEFNLSIFCPDPLFKSVDEFGRDVANVTAQFGFPIFSPMASDGDYSETTAYGNPYVFAGNVVGVYDFNQMVFLDNNGDFPTAPRIVVTATANVLNPKFYIDGGDFILLNLTVGVDDVVEIDCEEQAIMRNGVNISHLMSRDSTFITIPQGGLELNYTADSNVTALHARVYYNQVYKTV